ncbi:alpha/beta fold hydrolase [Kitasatospora paracochleata]|uniref:Pimeloyl-ACP methyl ester carboxylesterase n=1 Tax=Kitasatospora paracochleata TaxID=58354 RepID=A0ABT1IW25_9ACTN|nr:alpha/beta hydrolase [Kitasatospora paracochleata]MCP2308801.1 pimeloyl-ACP methyl ester carboxylesterase [Kitasatospora paracochleata]
MTREFDLRLGDGRTLHAYDTGDGRADDRLAVVWHHGTPNLGSPPAPLFAAADRLGLRWVSYDRPGYGGSTPDPGRDVASAAACTAAVADALGIERFAVVGHSGGGPHALACAALLPERVAGVIAAASLAPYDAEGLDWYAGMADSGVASLRAAAAGREAKKRHERSGAEYDPEFTPDDLAALAGEWHWLHSVVGPAAAAGPAALIDDDLAYVHPWGFDPARITAPLLLLHGERDRVVPAAHGAWLARHCPGAELRLTPEDGHVSVLTGAADALARLCERMADPA